MKDDELLERVRELLARASSESGKPIPTSALGRLRRTATAALRTGAGLAIGQLRGREMDLLLIERLVLSLGELKGIAMKLGQILKRERDAAGRALYEFYLGSLYRHGLFNADPHPGNLLFDANQRVVVLDHGCVREFDPATVSALADLSGAVRAADDARLRTALEELGVKKLDGPGFAVTRRLLQGFFEPVLKAGVRPMQAAVSLDVRELARNKRSMLQLQLPGKLLFLFRIRFGLYAVLARLGAQLDWQALEAEFSGRSS